MSAPQNRCGWSEAFLVLRTHVSSSRPIPSSLVGSCSVGSCFLISDAGRAVPCIFPAFFSLIREMISLISPVERPEFAPDDATVNVRFPIATRRLKAIRFLVGSFSFRKNLSEVPETSNHLRPKPKLPTCNPNYASIENSVPGKNRTLDAIEAERIFGTSDKLGSLR